MLEEQPRLFWRGGRVWLIAAALKAVGRVLPVRGFESLPLRLVTVPRRAPPRRFHHAAQPAPLPGSKDLSPVPMNVYWPNRCRLPALAHKSRSISDVAAPLLAGVVVAALLVVIAHNTVGFGSGHGYLIEEWVYDFITMSAALATLLP